MSRKLILTALLILFVIVFVSPAHSLEIKWQSTLGGNGTDVVSALQKTNNGYVLAGSSTSFSRDGNSSIYIAMVDESGHLLWNKTLSDGWASMGNSIAGAANGYYLAGVEWSEKNPSGIATVIKVDDNCNRIWRQSLKINNSTYSEANAIVSLDDGCIVAGYSYAENVSPEYKYTMFLAKLSYDGTISWLEEFPDIFQYRPKSIEKATNGYMVAGIRYTPYESIYSGFITKINGSGQEEWLYQHKYGDYQTYLFSLKKIQDDRYVATGGYSDLNQTNGIYMAVINETGDLIHTSTFPNITEARALSATVDGDNIVLTGWVISNSGASNLLFLKTTSDCAVTDSKGIGENGDLTGIGIVPGDNGNYVIAGTISTSATSALDENETHIFVAMISPENSAVPGSTARPGGDNLLSIAILLASIVIVAIMKKT